VTADEGEIPETSSYGRGTKQQLNQVSTPSRTKKGRPDRGRGKTEEEGEQRKSYRRQEKTESATKNMP